MDTISTFGTKTFPKFGGKTEGGSNSSTVEAVGASFNTLTSNLKGIEVVAGNEIYAQQAWIRLVEAQQMFALAFGGKTLN